MTSDPSPVPVHEATVTVRSYELDSFGHANHAVFLNWLELGRFEALRATGFPYHRIVAEGWSVFVVRLEIDYLAEARLDDRLVVRTWPAAFRRTSMTFGQSIARADDTASLLARADVTTVWVDSDRRPMRIPPAFRAALGGRTEAGQAGA